MPSVLLLRWWCSILLGELGSAGTKDLVAVGVKSAYLLVHDRDFACQSLIVIGRGPDLLELTTKLVVLVLRLSMRVLQYINVFDSYKLN